jgi:phosphoribosyl-ATP pyrophosphohydrolase
MPGNTSALLDLLFKEIQNKSKNGDSAKSYTTFLMESGVEKITRKITEEAREVADAALNKNNQEVIAETADLFFHILVLLLAKNIELKDIMEELDKRRHNTDLSEKAIAKNKIKLGYDK